LPTWQVINRPTQHSSNTHNFLAHATRRDESTGSSSAVSLPAVAAFRTKSNGASTNGNLANTIRLTSRDHVLC